MGGLEQAIFLSITKAKAFLKNNINMLHKKINAKGDHLSWKTTHTL
jgi:hypothetical protein